MKGVRIITAASLGFFLLLIISGAIGGALGNLLYYFALPVSGFSALFICKSDLSREKMLTIKGRELAKSIAYVFPAVLLVMAVSYLTGIFFSLFGIPSTEEISAPLPEAILIYALYPAIFEELLFRYIPLRLSHTMPRGVLVALSSVAFALVHADLTAFPYALLAGLIFILVDLKYKSVLPSLIMHFTNNACSVLYMLYSSRDGFSPTYFGVITLLALICLPFVIKREMEGEGLFSLTARDSFGTLNDYKELIALAIPTLLVAVADLL